MFVAGVEVGGGGPSDFGQGGAVRAGDGDAAGHGFEDGHAKAFEEGGEYEEVGAAATWTLSRVETPEARKLLLEAGGSDNKEVRDTLARVLGSESDSASQKVLLSLAEDSEETVRHAAMQSLAESGTTLALDKLIDVATDGGPNDRIAALEALGSSTSEKADDLLNSAMMALSLQQIVTANFPVVYGVYDLASRIVWAPHKDLDSLPWTEPRLSDPPSSLSEFESLSLLLARGSQA